MTQQPPDEAIPRIENERRFLQRLVFRSRARARARNVATLSDVRRMIRELPGGARVGPQEAHDFYHWLNEHGSVVRVMPTIFDYGTGYNAAVRAGLKLIAKGDPLRTFSNRLSEASEDVRQQIQSAYDAAAAKETCEGMGGAGRRQNDSIVRLVIRLADAVDMARQQVSSEGGQPPLAGPHTGAELLKDKFEEMSRCRFTFAPGEKERRGLGWVTPGTRFVAAGLQVWFPGITDAQLNTEMKYLRVNKDLPKPPPK